MWKKLVAILFGIVIGCWVLDDFDPDVVKGKRVLVTGASSGIGEQMAYHYAKLGADLLITARREEVLKKVVAKCRELGSENGQYHYIVADMSELNSTQRVISEAEARLGGLDVLVLNHIVVHPLGVWAGSQDNLTLMNKIFDVNFKAYAYLTSHALPLLENSQGSIVVVSSLAGKFGQPFISAYSASKFALDGFFSSLRQEFIKKNCDISITLCVLGFVGTDNSVRQLNDFGQHFLVQNLPMATPTDAAFAIIKGGARRAREIYFPAPLRVWILLRDWIPGTLEAINRYYYTYGS